MARDPTAEALPAVSVARTSKVCASSAAPTVTVVGLVQVADQRVGLCGQGTEEAFHQSSLDGNLGEEARERSQKRYDTSTAITTGGTRTG